MAWLIAVVAGGAVSFYLRFLWAMYQELTHIPKTRVRSIRKRVAPVNLTRIDPEDLWRDAATPALPVEFEEES